MHYHYTKIENETVPEPANKVKIRWLINEKQNAPNFSMRRFEIAPGGNTPYHTHEWEHEVYVLSGNALVKTKDGAVALKTGDVILIEPNEEHNFINSSEENFEFLCLIPLQK